MNRVEVKIEVLSYAKSQVDSYIVILSELNSERKLPIVIKPNDAQFISIKMEGIKTPRPMLQDLFQALTDAYQLDIQEVFIYAISEGVYYAKMSTSNSIDTIDIECTIGDALSMAVLYKCPIYVAEDVMEQTAINTEAPKSTITKKKMPPKKKKEVFTIDDLDKLLQEALESEDYELAVELRDKIVKLKKV